MTVRSLYRLFLVQVASVISWLFLATVSFQLYLKVISELHVREHAERRLHGEGGGDASTNYCGPAVLKGGRGHECVTYVFIFLISIIFHGLCKLTLSDQPRSPRNWESFRLSDPNSLSTDLYICMCVCEFKLLSIAAWTFAYKTVCR